MKFYTYKLLHISVPLLFELIEGFPYKSSPTLYRLIHHLITVTYNYSLYIHSLVKQITYNLKTVLSVHFISYY